MDQRDGALLLDQGTNQGGVGIEGVTADERPVQGAGRQGVDQFVRQSLFVTLPAFGQLHQRLAGLRIAEGDERGETAVQGLAVDREQGRQSRLRQLPGDHRAGQFARIEPGEHLAPAAFPGRGNPLPGIGRAAETDSSALGWRQLLHEAKKVADRASAAGKSEHGGGQHRVQRKLPARGRARVGDRPQRLGQAAGGLRRHAQLAKRAAFFSGECFARLAQALPRLGGERPQPEAFRLVMLHVVIAAVTAKAGRLPYLDPAGRLVARPGISLRIHEGLRQ